jgi:Snf7
MEHKVFESLKEGNKTLNALHSEMSVEDVDELMADTADAIARQNVLAFTHTHTPSLSSLNRSLAR